MLALDNGTLKEDLFDGWLKEFVSIAILISEDQVNRYLSTPLIEESFYIKAMNEYVGNMSSNSNFKLELKKALESAEPVKKFKHILMDNENEINSSMRFL